MSRSNRFTSNSNNNSKGGSNNRFSSLNDPADAKKPENRNKKDKDRESSSFSKNSNSRFDSLKEELPAPPSVETLPSPSPIINSNININSNYNNRSQYNSFRSATIIKKEEIKMPDLKEDDFPDLQLVAPVKKESTIVNKWAAAVKKEVKVVKDEDEEEKVYVEPGWICIRKNKKTGKTETIQGPLTEEQKNYDRIRYLEQHDIKYNMVKAIERMEERWNDYRTHFDELHGQGAYQEKYGVNLSYDSEDDDNYDSDSEYEYE
jgi:hypothetical protein